MPNEQKDTHGNPVVEVLYLKTNLDKKFHVPWSDTLQQVWDQAYIELKEKRVDGDAFECQDGHSLMGNLGQTLEQLRDQKICVDRKFQIRGPAGGA